MARFGRKGRSDATTSDTTTSTRGRGQGLRSVPFVGVILTGLAALVLPLWILAFLGWAIQLAGVSAVQYDQGRHFVMFDWFITAFEFVVLLSMPGYLLARRSTPGIVALKAVVTVLEILRTNVYNNARLGYNEARTGAGNFVQIDSVTNPGLNASRARINVLFSGYLITSFFNILLLAALGNLPAASAQDAEAIENRAKDHAAERHQPTAPAQPYTTTAVATAGPGETTTTVTEGPIYPGQAQGTYPGQVAANRV